MIDQTNPAAAPVAETEDTPERVLADIRERFDKLILLIPDPAYQDLFGSMRDDMRVLLDVADARQEQIDLAVCQAVQSYANDVGNSAKAYLQALSDHPVNSNQPT